MEKRVLLHQVTISLFGYDENELPVGSVELWAELRSDCDKLVAQCSFVRIWCSATLLHMIVIRQ